MTLKYLYYLLQMKSLFELSLNFLLIRRGTETEEQIQKRLKNAKAEIDRSGDATLFDHLLVNDKIDDTYDQLKARDPPALLLFLVPNVGGLLCGIDPLFFLLQKLLGLGPEALENVVHELGTSSCRIFM